MNPEYLAGRLGTGVGGTGPALKLMSNTRDDGHGSEPQFGKA